MHFFIGLRKKFDQLSFIFKQQPLSARGMLAAGLGYYLLFTLAQGERDLIAWILGGSALAFSLSFALLTTAVRIRVKNKLELKSHFEQVGAISKTQVPAGIVLKNLSLPALYTLRVKRKFKYPGAEHPTHITSGKSPAHRLVDSITFPHRGNWVISGYELELADRLGLSRLAWFIAQELALEVEAPTPQIAPIPIMAATSRHGDQISHTDKRSGDLFDIKQYDPSDGVKRILWKTYARSGELVVRRPEPAILPEGEVALYLIARRTDDHVAAAMQAYIRTLIDQNITVLFGTDALNETTLATHTQFFTEEEQIKRAINHTVWSQQAGSGTGFQTYLESMTNANKVIHQVVIFSDQSNQAWFESLARIASLAHIKISIVLVTEDLLESRFSKAPDKQQKLLNYATSKLPFTQQPKATLREFTGKIASSGSEVIICQSAEYSQGY